MAADGVRHDRNALRASLEREFAVQANAVFGHQDPVAASLSLVESAENEPPFIAGLLCRWVTGKRSIKGIYLSSLADAAGLRLTMQAAGRVVGVEAHLAHLQPGMRCRPRATKTFERRVDNLLN